MLENIIGLEIASLELNDLFSELKFYKNKFAESEKELVLRCQQKNKTCTIQMGLFSIKFHMQSSKSKSANDSKLYYELQKIDSTSHEPQILAIEIYHFEVKKNGEYGWMKDNDKRSFLTSKKLAEESIKTLINQSNA